VQNVVVDKPYVFVPPYQGLVWPAILQKFVRRRLQRDFGIERIECRGVEYLRESARAGHGILLAPNHCRPADPFVVSELARQAGLLPFTLASSHLFMQGRFQAFMLRRAGVFSIYREGMDRPAINAAVEILSQAKRPLVLFPEGVINRANDRLNPLMEGTSFIARTAAKRRAAATPAGQVVVHPVALRYTFHGDISTALAPALEELEHRLSWRPQRELALVERITKIGVALLGLKELEFFGESQSGPIFERVEKLIDRLLGPLEKEWLQGKSEGSVVARVKKLRTAILPDMVTGEVSEAERARRWRQLADVYLAQQLSCYPPDYITTDPHPDRLLETVERFEEDLKDVCRIYRPMEVLVEVAPAIAVSPVRDRAASEDPLLWAVETHIKDMLRNSR
jgi:1-acyl-sn-glycerol-3-phosphate acyltransferase